MIVTKLDVADIDGYDWNWEAKYLDEFVEELTKAYAASFVAEFPAGPMGIVQREAEEWARTRGAEQIVNITNTTRDRVREVVGNALRDGQSVGSIVKEIKVLDALDPAKARVIARTETATALGQGAKGAAIAQERDEKRWVTQGDDDVSDDCLLNENEGWIQIGDNFQSGVETIPQHPNCRCNVRYRTSELGADVDIPFPDIPSRYRAYSAAVVNRIDGIPAILRDFRCSGCKRLLGRDVHPGTRIHCRHCKEERTA
jgi:hypothetical protein